MHLTGWDARSDRVLLARGFNRLASVIQAARSQAEGVCLLLDNGDSLQGTPTADIAATGAVDGPHAWADCLNALNYDAIGLGNHDFDYGVERLQEMFGDVDAPVLCANLSGAPDALAAPYTILSRKAACSDGKTRTLRIGVTSVLPPQTLIWNNRLLAGHVSFSNPVRAAAQAVSDLRNAGVDLVITLCHAGPDPEATVSDENFGMALLRNVPGIDACIFGHVHLRFPDKIKENSAELDAESGTVCGVPSVMPGFAAECLGQIDLNLVWTGVNWEVAAHGVALLPAQDAVPDTTVTQIAAPFIHATRSSMNTPVSQTGHGFHTYFSMLQSGSAEAILAETMQTAITETIAQSAFADLPVLAAVAPTAAGGYGGPTNFVHVTKGVIRERHISMLCLYQNDIWATVMRGAQLYAYAEHAAMFFGDPRADSGNLVNPDSPVFNFDALHGLETVIDPFGRDNQGRMRRITDLRYCGQSIDPDAQFVVAMTSYRAAGGGTFPGLGDKAQLIRTKISLSDRLRSHLEHHPPGHMPASSVWRFADHVDAQVVIETSPDAAKFFDEIDAFSPRAVSVNGAGFLEVEVTL